jgi:hypothetical protein
VAAEPPDRPDNPHIHDDRQYDESDEDVSAWAIEIVDESGATLEIVPVLARQ